MLLAARFTTAEKWNNPTGEWTKKMSYIRTAKTSFGHKGLEH